MTDRFVIEQIRPEYVDELAELAKTDGDNLLDRNNRAVCVKACKSHNGLVMRNDAGTAIGCCFIEEQLFELSRATRPADESFPFTYVHQYLLQKPYRNRGLGSALLRGTIAFGYGRSDGPFPYVVGVGFEGIDGHAQQSIGVHMFPEHGFASTIFEPVAAMELSAERLRQMQKFSGTIVSQVLDMEEMPMIAKWALDAYRPQGVEIRTSTVRLVRAGDHPPDPQTPTPSHVRVRMIDHTNGRNGILRELALLADREPRALARIGLEHSRRLAG